MNWSILVIALWMGTFPEPHAAAIPGGCPPPEVVEAIAKQFADQSPHKADWKGAYAVECLDPGPPPDAMPANPDAPTPPPAPHIPGDHEA